MDERIITVTYSGGIDEELDKQIKLAISPLGYEWYGQEQVVKTGERDLSFVEVKI